MKPTTPFFPLLLKDTHGWFLLDPRTIASFSAEDKFARLHFSDGTDKVVFHSLNDLEDRLGCGQRMGDLVFIRTHRSCIAAFHNARAIRTKDNIELSHGGVVRLSKRVWPELIDVLGTVRGPEKALRSA
jgi:DNA-binding LytR/AlgR family response regulator